MSPLKKKLDVFTTRKLQISVNRSQSKTNVQYVNNDVIACKHNDVIARKHNDVIVL